MSIRKTDKGVRLQVYVQPRASRTEIAGRHGDALKIRVAAPPVEGEANAELEKFMAKLLGVARSRVSVVAGESSRQKVLHVDDVTAEEVDAAITRHLR